MKHLGVRNYVARNNMKAMKLGDLAFFYHSNCKVPGIAGIMEIAQESSVDGWFYPFHFPSRSMKDTGDFAFAIPSPYYYITDLRTESALNEKHPYFDPKSSRDSPKWHLVHVTFKQKFPELISLETLKSHAQPYHPLENMQLVKQSRLSVSKVTKAEWDFIMSLAGQDTHSAAATPAETAEDQATRMDVDDPAAADDTQASTEPSFEEELQVVSAQDTMDIAGPAAAAVSASASSLFTTPPPADTDAHATNGDSSMPNGHRSPSSQPASRAQSVQPPTSSLLAASSRPASRGLSVPPTATKRASQPGSRAGSRAPEVGPRARRSVSRGLTPAVVQAEVRAEAEVEVHENENGDGKQMMQIVEQQEEELDSMWDAERAGSGLFGDGSDDGF